SKDNKALAISKPAAEPWKLKIDVFANFAQFIYDDSNPENPLGARSTSGGNLKPNTDAWLLAWQVGARFNFPKNFYFQLAPVLYNYTGNGDTFNGHLIGAGIGQLKVKHDWQVQAFWMHNEQYSLDPNLIDSDFFDSRVNMEGVVVQAGYALSDAVIFNLSYGYGWRVDDALGTGGFHDIAINPLDKYQIFQADLNVKF